MKWLKLGAAALAVAAMLLLSLVGAAAWLLGSERGTAWLVAALEERAQPVLVIGGVSGALWSGVTFTEVQLRLPGHEVDIDRLRVIWDARALLQRELVIDELDAGVVEHRRSAGTVDRTPDAALTLPISVTLRGASIDQLTLAVAGEPLRFERLRLVAEARGADWVVEHFEIGVEALQLVGRGEVELGSVLRIAAEADWSGDIGGEHFEGRGAVRGDWPRLDVRHELAQPVAVVAEGELLLEPQLSAEVELRWADLAYPGIDLVRSPSGAFVLTGTPDAFSFAGSAQLLVDGEALSLELAARSDDFVLTVESATLDSAWGSARATGRIVLDPLSWDIEFDARDFDPALRLAEWPGRLDASGRLRGQLEPERQWSVSDAVLEGELRGFPFAARGAVAHGPGRWELEQVRLESGANVVRLSGVFADQLDLSIAADVGQLETLWPELRGAVAGEARILGTREEPNARGRFEATGLEYQSYRAQRLTLVSDIDAGETTALELEINAEELQIANLALARAEARIAGARADHAVSVVAEADSWSARLAARGALASQRWQGTVGTLTVDQDVLGEWQMSSPTGIAFSRTTARVDPFCVRQRDARLCGELRLEGGADDRLEVTAEELDVQALQPFFPEGFAAQGIYQASLSLADLATAPRGMLSIVAPATRLNVEVTGQPAFDTRVDDLLVNASLDGRALALEASFTGADTGVVNATLAVDDVEHPDPVVDAQLNVLWPDLAFLALLSPDVTEVGGALGVELTLNGRSSAPEVQGRAELNEGQLGVPALGLLASRIEVRALSTDGSMLEFSASGLVGEREFSLEGSTELDYRENFPTQLTLRGEALPAVQLPEVEIFVSPDLTATVRLPNIFVTGTVHVPRASVTIQELPAQAVSPSADTVVHGVEQPDPARPLQLRSELMLTLGDDVRYAGLDLDTRVTGELRMVYQSGRGAAASGVVSLDGTYNAYGQLLDLDRGELIFSGPLDDPALDVRAVREVGERTVGVQLTGTLKAPETRIFSNPPESEADALAYLLFGRPLTGSRGEETATLQTAALAMGLQQALPVVQRIGQAVGLDEFTVQTTDTDAGALMAGKYLSPNVYIRYSYGLFNRIGGLLLRFRINERLSLETRSADQKSMDLLYTVERN